MNMRPGLAWRTLAIYLSLLFHSTASAADPHPGFLFAIERFYQDEFESPSAISVDKKNNEIYVADSVRNEILIFDSSGKPLFKFGKEQGLSSPQDVLVRDNKIYVIQAGKDYLQVFNYRGEPIKRVAPEGIPFSPGRMNTDGEGNLYVTDAAQGACLVFDKDDKLSMTIGRGIHSIAGVAASKDRIYLLTPVSQYAIHVYDRKGNFIISFGLTGEEGDSLGLPTAIQTDNFGLLWVADALQGVAVLTGNGKRLLTSAPYGKAKGQVYFPIDIDMDGKGNVYLLEKAVKRVSVFKVDR